MAEAKTRPTETDPRAYIAALPDARRRREGAVLLDLHEELTGEKAVIWGTSIIGFGSYRISRGKDFTTWPIAGFSPRKASLTVYVMKGFAGMEERLARLGPHTSSVSCLYIKDLGKVDMGVLREIIGASAAWMRATHPE